MDDLGSASLGATVEQSLVIIVPWNCVSFGLLWIRKTDLWPSRCFVSIEPVSSSLNGLQVVLVSNGDVVIHPHGLHIRIRIRAIYNLCDWIGEGSTAQSQIRIRSAEKTAQHIQSVTFGFQNWGFSSFQPLLCSPTMVEVNRDLSTPYLIWESSSIMNTGYSLNIFFQGIAKTKPFTSSQKNIKPNQDRV